jgi:hypothetical protein
MSGQCAYGRLIAYKMLLLPVKICLYHRFDVFEQFALVTNPGIYYVASLAQLGKNVHKFTVAHVARPAATTKADYHSELLQT